MLLDGMSLFMMHLDQFSRNSYWPNLDQEREESRSNRTVTGELVIARIVTYVILCDCSENPKCFFETPPLTALKTSSKAAFRRTLGAGLWQANNRKCGNIVLQLIVCEEELR
jgi:hypothetical protein